MKKFSKIKNRIREFADNQGINIKEIYTNTGISDGTFSNSSGMNEENILKFFNYYKNVDANWLIKGEGSIFEQDEGYSIVAEPREEYLSSNRIAIETQKKMIEQLEQKVNSMESDIRRLKKGKKD